MHLNYAVDLLVNTLLSLPCKGLTLIGKNDFPNCGPILTDSQEPETLKEIGFYSMLGSSKLIFTSFAQGL
jgi:hypothetical protein